MTTIETNSDHFSPTNPSLRAAYQLVEARLAALPESILQVINVDIVSSVITASGVVPKLREVRIPDGVTVPGFDAAHFDELLTLADALAYTQVCYATAAPGSSTLDELVTELTTTRETLLGDATTLARHGIIDGRRLGELKGPKGYHNLTFDVLALVNVLRENEAEVVAKSALDGATLDRAELRARELVAEMGKREQATPVPSDLTEARTRAYTLFVTAYDQLRRAVSFIRWNEGDVDEIIPSLYAGKQRRKAAVVTDVPPVPAPAPASPTTAVAAAPGGSPFTSR